MYMICEEDGKVLETCGNRDAAEAIAQRLCFRIGRKLVIMREVNEKKVMVHTVRYLHMSLG